MSRIDEELTERLNAAGVPVDGDVLPNVEKRRRRVVMRRGVGRAALVVVVLSGAALGYRTLDRAFAPMSAPPTGVIVFQRLLRGCTAVPHVGGGLEVFAVTPDGATQWRINPDAMHSSRSVVSESDPIVSPDGTKLAFVDHYRGGLWVTDVAGGPTVQLTDGEVGSPVWSPDGTTIAYERWPSIGPDAPTDGSAEPAGIYAIAAGGGEAQMLAEGGISPTYAPDGATIAFVRSEGSRRSLWFMNPDGSDQREMATQPEDREFRVTGGEWSPDGGRFVAEVTSEGNTDLYVVETQGRVGLRLTDDPAADTSPAWSPDGDWIAFSTGRYGRGVGHSEIAIVPAAGGDAIRVTNDCWDDFEPSWAANDATVRSLQPWVVPPLPDTGPVGVAEPGQILFAADTQGVSEIYAIDPEGGTSVNLTGDAAGQGSPAWSPDGTMIAFSQYGTRDETGTVVMSRDGSDRRVVVPDGGRPSWSPDGTRLAVEMAGRGIGVVDLSTGSTTRLTDEVYDSSPAWSPDGSTIAFSREGTLALVDVASGDVTIVVKGEWIVEPDWSPDGAWMAFGTGRDIAMVRPDGSGLRNLTGGGPDTYERGPAWSPDGSRIAFVSDREGEQEIWSMDPDGSNLTKVDGGPGRVLPALDW